MARHRISIVPNMPKVGQEVTFKTRNGNSWVDKKGTIISSFGRVCVIDCGDKKYSKIYDDQEGLMGEKS